MKEEFLSPDIEKFDCHSSSIVETTKGNYCVIWKGGAGIGKSNIDMEEKVGTWLSRFKGNQWSTLEEVVNGCDSICWTPVLCKNPEGELFLFYPISPDPRNLVSFLKKPSNQGE